MSSTGYVWDPMYLGHKTSAIHPERPGRVERLAYRDLALELPGLKRIHVRPQLGLPWASRVHERSYIDFVREAHGRGLWALDAGRETCVREDTFDVAMRSLSGALSLLMDVAAGEVRNGFAAVRPPGHHAGAARARGFCIFNNAAACAAFAREHFGMERVLIVDWDVHPADGTMAIFYEDPDVHVLSLHQLGLFPKTVGSEDQVGRGAGEGATWNRNLPLGATGNEHRVAFARVLEEAARACRPDIVIVSAGFDGHAADPVGGWRLEEHDFAELTGIVGEVADRFCGGRLVSILEGGYNPSAVKRSVLAHVSALMAA
jgi:acetoin utilization deacetylase AcuC-like enzyme